MQIKDVEMSDVINVSHSHRVKWITKGFRLKFPEWLVPTFNKHVGQFKEVLDEEVRFMRDYDTKIHTRVQNMGDGQIPKFEKSLAEHLNKPKKCVCRQIILCSTASWS